ncbi:metal transporter Nramp3-like protein, partial [Tanacetum coccineum]
MSGRLGVATGRHLAELCKDEYPNWDEKLFWVMAELTLIGADIQDVRSAIAIKTLT